MMWQPVLCAEDQNFSGVAGAMVLFMLWSQSMSPLAIVFLAFTVLGLTGLLLQGSSFC